MNWMKIGLVLLGTSGILSVHAQSGGDTLVIASSKSVSFNRDPSTYFSKEYIATKNNAQQLILNPNKIKELDQLLENGIKSGAYPGCQVFAMKDGKIIYQKSIGTYNYGSSKVVTDTTLYDVASVTKIVSTTLAIMKLVDEGKLDVNLPMSNYLKEYAFTDKKNIKVSDLLLHQAGLKAYIPFYRDLVDKTTKQWVDSSFAIKADTNYTVPVAKNMYMMPKHLLGMWRTIAQSERTNVGKYVYSDLDLLLLEKIVERLTNSRLDYYVYDNFYQPLGLKYTFYNPWILGLEQQCAPTEKDNYFRMQHIQGYVHDQTAAMLGGVAGHAGIFSTAKEIGIIMQMLINGGSYNGKRYLKATTVQKFTSYNSSISRRGYGFDKPNKVGGDGPCADICSKATFGHTGFTGTCTWADPATGIVFVFLSNRVNPSADNNKLSSLKIRGKAQTLVYQALGYE